MKLLGNKKKGLLFILSAPAGTGKTTLVQKLSREFPVVEASISFTTRLPRKGEVSGKDYYFISKEEFEEKIAAGDFLEYVQLYGCYYGTAKSWVDQKLAEGKHVFLVIDTQGALKLKDEASGRLIFISPPSLKELEKRLKARKTDSLSVIKERLSWAEHEMTMVHFYNYHIVNDHLETAYHVLRSIVIAEEHRIR